MAYPRPLQWPRATRVILTAAGKDDRGVLEISHRPEGATRVRWCVVRLSQAVTAWSALEQQLALNTLNHRLQLLHQHLLSDTDKFIVGFNIKALKSDPEPPRELLLILVGFSGTYDALQNTAIKPPYIGVRGLIDPIPSTYASWVDVIRHIRNWVAKPENSRASPFLVLANHFIPDAVRLVEGAIVDANVHGSGVYIAQWLGDSSSSNDDGAAAAAFTKRHWSPFDAYHVTDARLHAAYRNEPYEEYEAPDGSMHRATYGDFSVVQLRSNDSRTFTLERLVDNPWLSESRLTRMWLRQVPLQYNVDAVLSVLACDPALAVRRAIQGLWFVSAIAWLYDGKPISVQIDASRRPDVHVVLVWLALAGAVHPWRPLDSADDIPLLDYSVLDVPRVLYHAYVFVQTPPLVVALPLEPLADVIDRIDLLAEADGSLLDLRVALPTHGEDQEFDSLFQHSEPLIEDSLIRQVVLNRMTAALFVEQYLTHWGTDPSKWPIGDLLVRVTARKRTLLVGQVNNESSPLDETFDIIVGKWLLMPRFWEHRCAIRPDGTLNQTWIAEAYFPFTIGRRDYRAYARHFVENNRRLVWYLWVTQRLLRFNRIPVPYTPPTDIVNALAQRTTPGSFVGVRLGYAHIGAQIDQESLVRNAPRPPVLPWRRRVYSGPPPAPPASAAAVGGGGRGGAAGSAAPGTAAEPAVVPVSAAVRSSRSAKYDEYLNLARKMADRLKYLVTTLERAYNRLVPQLGPDTDIEKLLKKFNGDIRTIESSAITVAASSDAAIQHDIDALYTTDESNIRAQREQFARIAAGDKAYRKAAEDLAVELQSEKRRSGYYNAIQRVLDQEFGHIVPGFDVIPLSAQDMLDQVLHHPSQGALLETLRISRERNTGTVSDRFATLREQWRAVLDDSERRLKQLLSMAHRGDPYGEALIHEGENLSELWRDTLDLRSLLSRPERVEKGARWPQDRSGYMPTKDQVDQVFVARITRLKGFARGRGQKIYDDYVLALEPLVKTLKDDLHYEHYMPDLPPDRANLAFLLPTWTTGRNSASMTLNAILAEARSKPIAQQWLYFADEVRKHCMDCLVTVNATDRRDQWRRETENFEKHYRQARRIDDYFAALLNLITNGWCAYARSRHWVYDNGDSARQAVLSTASGGDAARVLRWRSLLRWSDVVLSPQTEGVGGAAPPAVKRILDENRDAHQRLPSAEYEALLALDRLYTEAFDAATLNHSRQLVFRLRFLLLGGTLQHAWANIDQDAAIYEVYRSKVSINAIPDEVVINRRELADIYLHTTTAVLGEPATLTEYLTGIERAVLKIFTERLSTNVSLWGSMRAPANWWSGESRAMAYTDQRTTGVLRPAPSTASDADDMQGGTVALCEYLAFGSPVWKSFEERGKRKGLDDKKAQQRAAVLRPKARDIELEALKMAAIRYQIDAPDLTRFAAWMGQVWPGALARSAAAMRTFGRMTTTLDARGSPRLVLYSTSPSESLSSFVPRRGSLQDQAKEEGRLLVRALAQELAMLVYGASQVNVVGAIRGARQEKIGSQLVTALVTLLTALEARGKPGGRLSDTLGRWVFQASSGASKNAVPNVGIAAQWTQIVYMLTRDEAAWSNADGNVSAEERLAGDALGRALLSTMTTTMLERIEGAPSEPRGLSLDIDSRPRYYDWNQRDVRAMVVTPEPDQAVMRVAWASALAQTLYRIYEQKAPDDVPPSGATLEFLHSTLFRADQNVADPVPFFLAALPERPDELRVGGFSIYALADYLVTSPFKVQLSVLSRSQLWDLSTLFAIADGDGTRVDAARVATTLEYLLGQECFNRLLFVLDADIRSIDSSSTWMDLIGGSRLQEDGTARVRLVPEDAGRIYSHLHERAAYVFVAQRPASAGGKRFALLSAWANKNGTLDSLQLTSDPALPYFSAIHPVNGDARASTVLHGYARMALSTPPLVGPEAVDVTEPRTEDPVLNASVVARMLRYGSLALERCPILDWYAQLLALDPERREASDYRSVLNGTNNIYDALLQLSKRASVRSLEELDAARDAMNRAWLLFVKVLEQRYNDLQRYLDPAALASGKAQLQLRINAWKEERDQRVAEAYDKARQKIEKIIAKSKLTETDIRAQTADVVSDFRKTDEKDERRRVGFIALVYGLQVEAKERHIAERDNDRSRILALKEL